MGPFSQGQVREKRFKIAPVGDRAQQAAELHPALLAAGKAGPVVPADVIFLNLYIVCLLQELQFLLRAGEAALAVAECQGVEAA